MCGASCASWGRAGATMRSDAPGSWDSSHRLTPRPPRLRGDRTPPRYRVRGGPDPTCSRRARACHLAPVRGAADTDLAPLLLTCRRAVLGPVPRLLLRRRSPPHRVVRTLEAAASPAG